MVHLLICSDGLFYTKETTDAEEGENEEKSVKKYGIFLAKNPSKKSLIPNTEEKPQENLQPVNHVSF